MQHEAVADSSDTVEALRERVNEALGTLVPETEPVGLYEPVRYVLRGQGKRLRPVLLLLVAGAYGVPEKRALPAALAVELFHNFTLVHDDIMDNSPTRRGRPTVHVKWDVSTAILCGDYLMALSYEQLARLETECSAEIFTLYHRMVQGLCEGQTLDTAFEGREEVSVEEYLHMIDGKTGALLGTLFEVGGYLGEAPEADRNELHQAGREVGRAFQIQDDLLDLVAKHEQWGKVIGQDLIEGKKTYLLLSALERLEGAERTWFRRIVENNGLEPHLVDEARERMRASGVLKTARSEVHAYTSSALERLDVLPDSEAQATLRALLDAMKARLH